MTDQVSLIVNDVPIVMNYFVESFVDHTFRGMVESLDGTGTVHNLNLTIEKGKLSIHSNGSDIPVNEFVTKIFLSSTNGILAPLKGFTQPVKTVKLTIRR